MDFNYVITGQYLLKSHRNYTITLLSTPQIENISHDTINRYLRYESLNSQEIIETFASQMKKKNWFANTAAYLIFDDTVINKKYGYDIELVRRQYNGREHKVIDGVEIVNCIYFNRGMNNYGLYSSPKSVATLQ